MTDPKPSRAPTCPSCHEKMTLEATKEKSGGRKWEQYACPAPCNQKKEQVVNESGKRLVLG